MGEQKKEAHLVKKENRLQRTLSSNQQTVYVWLKWRKLRKYKLLFIILGVAGVRSGGDVKHPEDHSQLNKIWESLGINFS